MLYPPLPSGQPLVAGLFFSVGLSNILTHNIKNKPQRGLAPSRLCVESRRGSRPLCGLFFMFCKEIIGYPIEILTAASFLKPKRTF